MSDEKITYRDVEEYEKFFTLAPTFLLERFAKKNTNIVLKFESKAESYLSKLTDSQKSKLDIVLNTKIDELQSIMDEAYRNTGKKQYQIFANPKYREFIEINLKQLDKMVNK
ncbi:hypothetical protein [Methanobrevibacter sp.]|uniref:hypothetical protein n=1 Tax=Methanobrevibacter sp. TaxID=66852 RepID=UPI0025D5CEC3|nr:hypothetical protein [Methanobrevibacter sp.]MBQ6512382.1 hypothetical protein [Methanobrevibacter sp.]